MYSLFFFFNDTATTEIYTLSLHDALPICSSEAPLAERKCMAFSGSYVTAGTALGVVVGTGLKTEFGKISELIENIRSEEHTSELQSHSDLVCRLLLEKKKQS